MGGALIKSRIPRTRIIFLIALLSMSGILFYNFLITKSDRIQPYSKNPGYWEYKGQPILLLGGSKDDNLFQIPELEEHLDQMHEVGGNFIRNTMSSRDNGNVFPFLRLANGKFDLDRWNPEYWNRFQNLLKLTSERDIIVQIEIWDRFDHSQDFWLSSPWNPVNNVSYTTLESGLEGSYPEHPWLDLQPFFHTPPGMPKFQSRLDLIRKYQEAFVRKLLAYSLPYGNVLYCMDNETSTPPEWGKYWIDFVKSEAAKSKVEIFATDMFDEFYRPRSCEVCQNVIVNPDVYMFLDISQINSRNFDQNHWDTLQWILNEVKEYPRPVNHTKVYGGGNSSWGSGSHEDGVERFCRNIIGGSAGARFHRPWAGSGLNALSVGAIKSFRKLETQIKMWDVQPRMDLLLHRSEDEAYLTADEGNAYALYFTDGGSVTLKLELATGPLKLSWINVNSGEWGKEAYPISGKEITVSAPGEGGWIASITVQ